MFFIIVSQTHPGHQKMVSSFSVRQWKWTPPSSWRQEERFSILFLTVPHLKRAFLLIICKIFITNSPFIRAMCYSPCPLALPLSFKLVCNLLLPPLFGFCLATAVGVVFLVSCESSRHNRSRWRFALHEWRNGGEELNRVPLNGVCTAPAPCSSSQTS